MNDSYLDLQFDEAIAKVAALKNIHLSKVIQFTSQKPTIGLQVNKSSAFTYIAVFQVDKLTQLLEGLKKEPTMSTKPLKDIVNRGSVEVDGKLLTFHPDMIAVSRDAILMAIDAAAQARINACFITSHTESFNLKSRGRHV